MTPAGAPVGWPPEVPPPVVEGWETKAVGWLLDLCPAEYRAHQLLRRHPALLAWLAVNQVEAQLEAARHSYSELRRTFGPSLGPDVVAQALATLEAEGARLLATRRSVRLVADALARA